MSLRSRERAWLIAVSAIGLILYAWLLSRSWVGRDQIQLLKLGQDLVETGRLSPVGKSMSGGGVIPGSLLQILIGLPLFIWQDYRAPLVLLGLLNIAAGIILFRVLRNESRLLAWVYFILYWLSPWRLYHASMFWEPAYLFLPAALHCWSCKKLQMTKNFLPSVTLGFVLAIAPQLHGSFLFLWILTALLVWKKQIVLHWKAVSLGVLVGSLSLIPTIAALFANRLPSSLPSEGFIGRGFLYVYPTLKGVVYFLRLPTLDVGEAFNEIVYFNDPSRVALQIVLRIIQVLMTATIIVSVAIAWEYFRKRRKEVDPERQYSWLERYAGYSLIALVISAGLAPFDLQSWHVIVALHAALIPFALWVSRIFDRHRRRMSLVLIAYGALAIIGIIAIGIGKPSYRKRAIPREVLTAPSVVKLLPGDLPMEAP